MRKQFQRMRQQGLEIIGKGERSDELTGNLMEIEKKVDGLRNGCHVTTKRLVATMLGSGSTLEKHQKRVPQYNLGVGMIEAGMQLGQHTLFGSVLGMVGTSQQDIALQTAQYEICVSNDIIAQINTMLEEDTKVIDKSKKKLQSARLDMDTVRSRLKTFEHQNERTASREYQIGKLDSLKTQVDEVSRKFEVCQDAYATAMFNFLSKEHLYTEKIQQMVKQQLSLHKQAVASLEAMLPQFDKKRDEIQDQPIYGRSLDEHLRVSKREIALVIAECVTALRENWMDTEGLFRLAASAAKTKFLKSAFDAGQKDLSSHDPHTIAGCLKMYLRDLPDPLLTLDLYSDWSKTVQIKDYNERMKAMWTVKEKLPEPNHNNLKYLVAFLHEFAQYQEVTKMGVSNIAIVIGPNLLWPREETSDPAALMAETVVQRTIAEILIEHCHYFFPDLPETPPPCLPTSPLPTNSPPTPSTPSTPSQPTPAPRQDIYPPKPKPFAEHMLMATAVQMAGIILESGTTTTPSPEGETKPVPQPVPRSTAPQMPETPQPTAPKPTATVHPLTPPTAHKPISNETNSQPPPTAPKPASQPPPKAPKPNRTTTVTGTPPSPTATTKSVNGPPSPAPKPRSGSRPPVPLPVTRTASNDSANSNNAVLPELSDSITSSDNEKRNSGIEQHNGIERSPSSNSVGSTGPPTTPVKTAFDPDTQRPTPPIRTKRITNSPKTTAMSRTGSTRGPSRRAPPPPVKKPPPQMREEEEVTGL